MNGYTRSTTLKERISNLIEQIPADIRNRAVAECVEDNPHDFERALTSYVISRSWLAELPQSEHEQQQAEAVKVLDWLDGTYPSPIILGGEVVELTAQTSDSDNEIPF